MSNMVQKNRHVYRTFSNKHTRSSLLVVVDMQATMSFSVVDCFGRRRPFCFWPALEQNVYPLSAPPRVDISLYGSFFCRILLHMTHDLNRGSPHCRRIGSAKMSSAFLVEGAFLLENLWNLPTPTIPTKMVSLC